MLNNLWFTCPNIKKVKISILNFIQFLLRFQYRNMVIQRTYISIIINKQKKQIIQQVFQKKIKKIQQKKNKYKINKISQIKKKCYKKVNNNRFKQNNNNNNKNNKNNNNNNNNNKYKNNNSNNNKHSKLIILNNNNKKLCKKSPQTVLFNQIDIRIQIIDHEIIQGSILRGGAYAIYHIKTYPLNWNVKRTYNDFIWLQNILIKIYPGISVPQLPETVIQFMDDKLANKRKAYYERFLQEITNQPQLKNSKYFCEFLQIQDNALFKQIVKDSEKINKPKKLNELENTEGKYFINKDNKSDTNAQIIEQYFSQNDVFYERLQTLSKQLINGYRIRRYLQINEQHQCFGRKLYNQLNKNV
ncbi:hypothetical protein IMG5_001010 [Ichthyophthirius multifiliis]|uniref:PX domain-containing protein n=1 Tax=Ichthyophthirius multifiliis TaxID=5932 RepID=G0QIY7_ICHMU|nr:hypothetical protein IMG5_001010 [Ichthyophthirius multifiliis]EGR34872.1 hypothetical protein IMG5_001010 [Ichthyophthirius multifiliis]|eukprot:XP_004040176.1 hypothetical protein IMG5_001010 [Ichthyophthirius multifiliis]